MIFLTVSIISDVLVPDISLTIPEDPLNISIPRQSEYQLEQNLIKLADEHLERGSKAVGVKCKICGKYMKDWYKAKSHLESIHFPTEKGYQCSRCGEFKNTKKALDNHKSKRCR